MYALPPASSEQQHILRQLLKNNVVTNAVAGSGKTTTILHIAQRYPERRHLLLTYNAKLKEETRQRVRSLDLTNLEVHSYHSWCVRYIHGSCYTDSGIREQLPAAAGRRTPTWNAVIIDETQDMTKLYCQVARRAIGGSDGTATPHVVVLGDIYQALYEFNGADRRYITLSPRLFGDTRPWSVCKLSTSYRVNKAMAAFVNGLIGEQRIQAVKVGPRPHYMCAYDISDKVIAVVEAVGAENIFILAPSVRWKRSSNPLARLANRLATQGIPLYMPSNDEMNLNEDILHNKLVFSSFHQAKGLERKVVFVCSFDNAYFQYYNRDDDPAHCTNALYVACTRATEMLYLWAGPNNLPFRFISQEVFDLCSRSGVSKRPRIDVPVTYPMSVTNLIRHTRADVLDAIIARSRRTTVQHIEDTISIPVVTPQMFGDVELLEEVADITGTAVAAYCEYRMHGESAVTRALGLHGDPAEVELPRDIKLNELDPADPSDILHLVNCYQMGRSRLIYRLKQVTDYTWLSQENLDLASERLFEFVGATAQFEQHVEFNNMEVPVNGYIDVIDGDNVYELKTVKALGKEHILQLLIYAHALRSAGTDSPTRPLKYYLFNILTGELLQIDIDDADLICCMKYINHIKFHKCETLSDAAFIMQLDRPLTIADECAACAKCNGFMTSYPIKKVIPPD